MATYSVFRAKWREMFDALPFEHQRPIIKHPQGADAKAFAALVRRELHSPTLTPPKALPPARTPANAKAPASAHSVCRLTTRDGEEKDFTIAYREFGEFPAIIVLESYGDGSSPVPINRAFYRTGYRERGTVGAYEECETTTIRDY